MKKIITLTIILCCISAVTAQMNNSVKIKNNRLSVKKIEGLITVPSRIPSSRFENLKPQQIAKLRASAFDRAALSKLRIIKHWEITPNRMKDKNMYVDQYFGKYEARPKYIHVYPENKYYPKLDAGNPGFLPERRYLILKYTPEKGKRYRMHIKLKPGNYRNKKIVTETSLDYIDTWYINDQYDEVMFDFIASSPNIKITPIIAGHERYYTIFEPLEIEKINIDRVE